MSSKKHRNRENREDPSRGVFIRREIDYSLFKELLPEIIRLRGENVRPISVYLDSNGGDVFFANLLTSLIRCPTQSGASCRVVTIAAGFVASAAADMLAMGDYAIAYPFSQIHYHGTRQQGDDITLDKIPSMAASLRATNEHYAFRLAARMFRRMVFHMVMESQQQKEGNIIGPMELLDETKVNAFIESLSAKLKGQEELIKNTKAKQIKFGKLVASLVDANDVDINNETALFKHVLDVELGANPGVGIQSLLPVMEEDFAQIRDFFFGVYQKNLKGIIANSGTLFLSPTETAAYLAEETKSKKDGFQFLVNTVSPRLAPLWFFVVSLCRTLQEGEYPMTPEQAYWAGLVDEVIGKPLPCMRVEMENSKSSSTEPRLPVAQSGPSDGLKETQPGPSHPSTPQDAQVPPPPGS